MEEGSAGYVSRQDQMNAAYRREYAEWIATMTPADIAALKKLGLHEPHASHTVGGHAPTARGDIAESPRAATATPEPPVDPDPDTDPPPSAASSAAATREAISRLVSLLLMSKNLRLDAYALAFAANLDALNGIGTQGEVAKKLGLSATMVSRRTEHIRELLDLPYSPHQKGKTARTAASKALLKDHWRNRKTTTPTPPTP